MTDRTGGEGRWERFERSEAGRTVLSGLLAFTLIAMVVAAAPPSELKRQLNRVTGHYTQALGLDQVWGVFAPNPRREVIGIFANVRFSNGKVRRWELPRGGAAVGAYWDYRWLKWMEWMVNDEKGPLIREPGARWIAGQEHVTGARPVSVSIYRRSRENLPPGPGPNRGPWRTKRIYALDLRAPG